MASDNLIIRGIRTENGRTTTVKLESEFWDLLQEICTHENKSLSAIVRQIDGMRGKCPRTSAIRVFILKYFRSLAALAGERFTDANKNGQPSEVQDYLHAGQEEPPEELLSSDAWKAERLTMKELHAELTPPQFIN